ncbi:MAG: hypothetical protein ACLFM1_09450 [Bacteroidales bacterium]
MIDNYKELQLVKREIENRVHQTEHNYIQQYKLISAFLDLNGVHKGKKNEDNRKYIHSLILQSITESIKDQKIFDKVKDEYKNIIIPIALTLISSFFIRKL